MPPKRGTKSSKPPYTNSASEAPSTAAVAASSTSTGVSIAPASDNPSANVGSLDPTRQETLEVPPKDDLMEVDSPEAENVLNAPLNTESTVTPVTLPLPSHLSPKARKVLQTILDVIPTLQGKMDAICAFPAVLNLATPTPAGETPGLAKPANASEFKKISALEEASAVVTMHGPFQLKPGDHRALKFEKWLRWSKDCLDRFKQVCVSPILAAQTLKASLPATLTTRSRTLENSATPEEVVQMVNHELARTTHTNLMHFEGLRYLFTHRITSTLELLYKV